MWVGTADHGLVMLDHTHGLIRRFRHDPGDPSSLSNDSVQSVLENKLGQIWVGTSDGLNFIDPLTGKVKGYPLGSIRPGTEAPSDTEVHALLESADGVLGGNRKGTGQNRPARGWPHHLSA